MNKISLLQNNYPYLQTRAEIIAAVRDFFSSRGFMEVETPVMISSPAPEEFIEAPAAGQAFLRTSPELEMKQLLCAGYKKIYQLGPCFRQGETGRCHRPEFTMLEWYEVGIDYRQLLNFTVAMLRHIVNRLTENSQIVFRGRTIDFALAPEIIQVSESYRTFAGIEAAQAIHEGSFDQMMVEKIEPQLGNERITFLIDYPPERAALATIADNDGGSYAERWELYLGGLEIANAYNELTDANELRERFATAAQLRSNNQLPPYPEAEDFFTALEYGMPTSSGCALGIDRLVMALTDADDINKVGFPDGINNSIE